MVFQIKISILLWCLRIFSQTENLKATINIGAEYRQLEYTLISFPLYLAGFIKQLLTFNDEVG
jgi:hypothetical protein